MARYNKRQTQDASEVLKGLLADPEVRLLYEKERIKSQLAMAVKASRQRAHMTQSQLAKKAGTTQGVIARIEGGNDLRTPTMPLLARIAAACGADLEIAFKFSRVA